MRMSHLRLMRWNYLDQLEATSRQVVNNGLTPDTTYYVYDASGRRVRKVSESQVVTGQTPTRRRERIYLGGFEAYREYDADGATTLERQTLHVIDGRQRVALVETRVQGDDGSPVQLIRYQLANHLGSASLELDNEGQIVSYEEYYPYGNTSYQAVRSDVEVSLKRYRHTGKERDEETGFYYNGARYYAAWLGRWTSADPIGIRDGVNLYSFVSGNPIGFRDLTGTSKSPFQPGDVMNKSQAEAYRADPTTVASGALPVLLPDKENYLVLPQGAYTTHPGESSGTAGHRAWSFSEGREGDHWKGVYGETANALAEKKANEVAASRILASKKMIQGVTIIGVVGGVTGGVGLAVSGSLGLGGTILVSTGEGVVGGGLTEAGLTWLEGGSAGEILSSGGSGALWGGGFGLAGGTLGGLIRRARQAKPSFTSNMTAELAPKTQPTPKSSTGGPFVGDTGELVSVADDWPQVYVNRSQAKPYVGQTRQPLAARQAQHEVARNTGFPLKSVGRARPTGKWLDVTEEMVMRAHGTPTTKRNPAGTLLNKRVQMSELNFRRAGGYSLTPDTSNPMLRAMPAPQLHL